MDFRQQTLQYWLADTCRLPPFDLQPMVGDASFRRYFRVRSANQTYVAMDAPLPNEHCGPFVAIAKALQDLGLHTPDIIKSDIVRGFLLMSDFGDDVLLKQLNHSTAESLYRQALNALFVLQTCRDVDGMTIPFFTKDFMREELELFKEWFLKQHLNMTLSFDVENQLAICFDFLAKSAVSQTQVFMHRDYHSANLMVLPANQIGILDFQDAFIGPVTYDVVSLLRDCYITWPDRLVTQLALYYFDKLQLSHVSADQFLYWFDLMGIQRHLKALLTFARKYRRDNNPNYLQHIPRTLEYILKVSSRYPQCHVLHSLLLNKVITCVQ